MDMLGETLFISKMIPARIGGNALRAARLQKKFLRRSDPAEESKQQSEDGWLSPDSPPVAKSSTPTIGGENHQSGPRHQSHRFHLGYG